MEESYLDAEMQQVYSSAPADKAEHLLWDRWRRSWSQYSNEIIQEISRGLQEPWR